MSRTGPQVLKYLGRYAYSSEASPAYTTTSKTTAFSVSKSMDAKNKDGFGITRLLKVCQLRRVQYILFQPRSIGFHRDPRLGTKETNHTIGGFYLFLEIWMLSPGTESLIPPSWFPRLSLRCLSRLDLPELACSSRKTSPCRPESGERCSYSL